jgi:hypothetical protein
VRYANDGLRFLLELAALASLGYWGFAENDGVLRWVLGIGLPVLAAAVWGTFVSPKAGLPGACSGDSSSESSASSSPSSGPNLKRLAPATTATLPAFQTPNASAPQGRMLVSHSRTLAGSGSSPGIPRST